MEGITWLGHNWFALVQTGGIVSALAFAGVGFFLDARARRVGNLIKLTDRHRSLWERMYSDPKLARILDPAASPERIPVTAKEELFIIFLILHLANTYYTVRSGFLKQPEGLARDIQLFFSLPIPRVVWHRVHDLQDRQFVRFVENCLSNAAVPDAAANRPDPRSEHAPRTAPTTRARRRA